MARLFLLAALCLPLWAAAPAKRPAAAPAKRPAPVAEEDSDDADAQTAGGIVKFGQPVRVAEGEQVDGPVVAVGGSVQADGAVNGPVVAIAGSVRLGPRSEVNGPAVALGGEVVRATGSRVGGPIVETPGSAIFGRFAAVAAALAAASVSLYLVIKLSATVGWIVLALALAALFPAHLERTRRTLDQTPGRCAFAGVLLWPGVAAVAFALVVSLVGVLLLPLLLGPAVAAYLWGFAAMAQWLGWKIAKDHWDSPLATMAVGMILLEGLQWLPMVRPFVFLAAALWGAGAAVASVFGTRDA